MLFRSAGDQYVIIYPENYASADDITKLIPFEEAFLNAKENDKALYNELAKLTSKTNTSYYFNKDKISPYFSANVTVSKEIGRYFTVAFYANNFFNSLMKVKSSANDTETSLFESSRISRFNYGVSLRVKL